MSEPEKARANGLVSEERKRHKVIPPQLTEVTVLVDDKWVLCFHVFQEVSHDWQLRKDAPGLMTNKFKVSRIPFSE